MHRRNLLVGIVLAGLCAAVPASAGQRDSTQAKRNHPACPQKQAQEAAAKVRWAKPATPAVTTPIEVSAGGLPSPSLRRFAPDLLP
jgi:glucose/arabinose dehydrogenase